MSDYNDEIKNAIAGGLIGAALGAMITGKSKAALASSIAGAAIGASLKAQKRAKESKVPVLYASEGSIYRLHPNGKIEFVRDMDTKATHVPKKFSLE